MPFRAVLAVLALLTAVPTASAQVRTSAPDGSPLALVLRVEGDAHADKAPISAGSLLTEGQTLDLKAEAIVEFSLITSCKELIVAGPGKATLTDGAVALDGAWLVDSKPSPGCVKNDRVVLSTASQLETGAVVVRGGSKGRVAPRAGVIPSSRRRLVWDGPLADGRGLLLTITSGEEPDQILLEEEIKGNEFEVPAQLALVPGASYAWTVEPSGLNPGPSLAGSFRVADASIASQLKNLREQAGDAQGWLRVAFFCEVHMLETDAAEAYAQAVTRDPRAEGAVARLAELDLP
ncbi:MAG: hypothetical protein GY898_13845 [Proteobacteria bacterium]|nr:hypothetical protein [Pseudomonadota bacterium]